MLYFKVPNSIDKYNFNKERKNKILDYNNNHDLSNGK